MKTIDDLAEEWANKNSSLIVLTNPPISPKEEVKRAFLAGFNTAIELAKDAWDAGYLAGKVYGEENQKVREDA